MTLRITSKAECDARLKQANSRLVVIDFHASWCDPCQKMAPVYEALASQHLDVVFMRADVDECEGLVKHFGIKCMPTYVFVRNRKQIEVFSGANETILKELVFKLKKKKC